MRPRSLLAVFVAFSLLLVHSANATIADDIGNVTLFYFTINGTNNGARDLTNNLTMATIGSPTYGGTDAYGAANGSGYASGGSYWANTSMATPSASRFPGDRDFTVFISFKPDNNNGDTMIYHRGQGNLDNCEMLQSHSAPGAGDLAYGTSGCNDAASAYDPNSATILTSWQSMILMINGTGGTQQHCVWRNVSAYSMALVGCSNTGAGFNPISTNLISLSTWLQNAGLYSRPGYYARFAYFNRSLSLAKGELDFLHRDNATGTYGMPAFAGGGGGGGTLNSTITATDIYNGSTIYPFSVHARNTTHSHDLSTAAGNISLNHTGWMLLNFSSGAYFNVSVNATFTSGGTATTTMPSVIIAVEAKIWQNNLTASNINASIGTYYNESTGALIYLYAIPGTLPFNVSAHMLWPNTTLQTFTARTRPNLSMPLYSSFVTVDGTNLIGGAALSNFTLRIVSQNYSLDRNLTTTNGTVTFFWVNDTLNMTLDAQNALLNWSLRAVNDFKENITISTYATNTVNITFYIEGNNTVATFLNITAEFISTTQTYLLNTTNGTIYRELITPESYTIRYGAAEQGYPDRFYYFVLENRTYNRLSLYLFHGSLGQNVTLTLRDENSVIVEGAEVRSLRYHQGSNSYIHVETAITNFVGESYFNMALNQEYYRFQVYVPKGGTLIKTTEPTYITSTALSLQVVVGGRTGEEYYRRGTISAKLNYTVSTANFNYEFSDAAGTATQGCLEVFSNGTGGAWAAYNSSCVSGTSGNIILNAPEDNGTTYYARGSVDYDGNREYLAAMYYAYRDEWNTGSAGVLLAIFLIITFSAAGVFGPAAMPIMAGLGLMFAHWSGVLVGGPIVVIPVLVLSVLLSYLLSGAKRE